MADQDDEELENVTDAIQELKRLKIKDLQLTPFSGTQREWKQFKIVLFSSLSDYDLQDVLDGTENFPLPQDEDHPTQLEKARIRHFVLRDRKLKQILLQATKGDALAIVMSGAVDEAAKDA